MGNGRPFFPAGSSFDKVLTAQLTAAAGPVGPRGLRAAPAGDAIPKDAAVRDRESAVGASGVHMISLGLPPGLLVTNNLVYM